MSELRYLQQKDGSYLVKIGARVITANEEALFILQRAHEGVTGEALIKATAARFDLEQTEAEAWVGEAIKQLGAEKERETDDLHLSVPLAVQWKVTNRCNLNCKHCYVAPWKYTLKDEITADERKIIAQKLIDAGVISVLFTGGECMLLPDTVELMKMMYDAGIELKMFSNALLLPKYQDQLLAMKDRLLINISVDGDRTYHNMVRGADSYDKIVKTIRELTGAGAKVVTNMVVNRLNFRSFPNAVEELIAAGVKSVQFSHMAPHGNALDNVNDLHMSSKDYAEFEGIVRKTRESLYQKGVRASVLYRPIPGEGDSGNALMALDEQGETVHAFEEDWSCCAGRTRITIDPLGNVIPCSFFSLQYGMGNLVTQSLEEIWQHENRGHFVDMVKEKSRSRLCAAYHAMEDNLKNVTELPMI